MTTQAQAIAKVAKDLKVKFDAVQALHKISGIHMSKVLIICVAGYNEQNDGFNTPSEYYRVALTVGVSSVGRLMVEEFKINGVKQEVKYGGMYISNVQSALS